MTVVLDSWAVLRYLEDDGPAAESVERLLALSRPMMSWLNLGEVHYILARRFGDASATDAVRDLEQVLDVRLPGVDAVLSAARLKARHPMSYADAFAASLALRHDGELWTGDPELLVEDASWRWRDLRSG